MNITEQELKKLEDAQDDMEWNKAVDEIKAARDGVFRRTGTQKLFSKA